MTENSATIATHILKEILAKDVLFPNVERTEGILKLRNSVKASKFNISHDELLSFMGSFQDKGLLKIFGGDLVINWSDENGKQDFLFDFGVSSKNKDEKRVNYELKDKVLVEDFIKILNKSMEAGVGLGVQEHQSDNEITVGSLSYKNGHIYHNGSIVKNLTPQAVKAGALFLRTPDEYISYKRIQDEISTGGYVSKENMQKIVTKLRKALRDMTNHDLIKNVDRQGYNFEATKIR